MDDLDRARSEVLAGSKTLALCHIRSVVDRSGELPGDGAAPHLSACTELLKRMLHDSYGKVPITLAEVKTLNPKSTMTRLGPEDAFLLSLAEVGMTLDDLADVSPMPEAETWYRMVYLLNSGLLTASVD